MKVRMGSTPTAWRERTAGRTACTRHPTAILSAAACSSGCCPYLEQQPLANAYNYSLINWTADNATVGATGLSALWCPSDASIAGLRSTFAGWGWDGSTQTLVYTSYAGNMGTFCKVPITITSPAQHQAVLNQANGVFFYLGWPAWNPPAQPDPIAPLNPGSVRPATLASVTDGLSNTFAFGEKAHGKFSQTPDVYYSIDYHYNGAWVSGRFGDTLFTTLYPMNPFNRIGDDPNGDYFYSFDAQEDNFSIAASSFHPGGCNFALPRRLGPLRQGDDQHLAVQPDQRGADEREL